MMVMTSETSSHQPWTLLGICVSFHHLMTEFLCELIKLICTAHKNISVFLPPIFAFSRTYGEGGHMGLAPLPQQSSLDIFAQDYVLIPVHPQAHDTITSVCLGYCNTMPPAGVFFKQHAFAARQSNTKTPTNSLSSMNFLLSMMAFICVLTRQQSMRLPQAFFFKRGEYHWWELAFIVLQPPKNNTC